MYDTISDTHYLHYDTLNMTILYQIHQIITNNHHIILKLHVEVYFFGSEDKY